MTRKTLIFGNGLGMGLSPELFSLDNALAYVWEDDILSDAQKGMIRACLPEDTEYERPSSEEDLYVLQRVLASCDFLDGIELEDEAHWLSEHGREFPSSIRKFVHQVACCFHDTGEELPYEFVEPLTDFIHETKSHVATLNYDPLLYEAFLGSHVLRGYNGDLIDGMTRTGFSKNNMMRKNPDRLGWYLHLHGSPLFYDAPNGRIKKFRRHQLIGEQVDSTHLVLTHVRHKTAIISASSLLSEYWRFLGKALKESSEVVLFGYSGYDTHLNNQLASRCANKHVRVVEWSGSQPDNDRLAYWRDKLKNDVEVVHLDSILDFVDW
ncbi:SIR2 family protein [Shimia sp. R9_3]|uniref:SIR2 family protein n=1 Tax=Shimia sp. R9_3 TaxID=2821113 RepID=UPI001AD9647B|nr:SIR2 family protein [Shimia sp. R9_3]MBO9400721.1 SIR2 family protein [Shimia sp. R9_3]